MINFSENYILEFQIIRRYNLEFKNIKCAIFKYFDRIVLNGDKMAIEENSEFAKINLNYPSYWLRHWEDAIGHLERIWRENGLLKAIIGKLILILPIDLEEKLQPLLGQRISILHTDIREKEWLIRVLPDRRQETVQVTADLCENEQILNCDEVI
jgi:hypothetical protein